MNPFEMVNAVCNKLVEDHLTGLERRARRIPGGRYECAGTYKDAEYSFIRPTAAEAEDDERTFIAMVDRLEINRA